MIFSQFLSLMFFFMPFVVIAVGCLLVLRIITVAAVVSDFHHCLHLLAAHQYFPYFTIGLLLE